MKTTASKQTVIAAINAVNEELGYMLSLNRADQSGKWFNFTLRTPSRVPGSRTSASGRQLAKASWHAHGHVFDQIFSIEPKAVIVSMGTKITAESGNWEDRNVGNYYNPVLFSQTSNF